ncbi:conserved hypothetical protein [Ricinus communis]|uniref:Uncharacterized protein n=1 Tax=Ricinus communis TaxID=3988 RepID=B9TIW3_RICCO|nr:conserved hypothetical protein [Ricinus communis]
MHQNQACHNVLAVAVIGEGGLARLLHMKLWTTFVDAIKPQALRRHEAVGLHSIYVDKRPFSATFQER